jgi:hypothetical protein
LVRIWIFPPVLKYSKVWANEIIHGAPTLGEALDESLYDWAKMKEAKIRQWVEDKRILPVEPSSLLYMIWASTRQGSSPIPRKITLVTVCIAFSNCISDNGWCSFRIFT